MVHHKTDSGQVLPFFVTIPHSGELVPPEATWLQGLSEVHLMRDVDRYVDKVYEGHLKHLKIPYIKAECHRYVIDLNRLPGDFDAQAVLGAVNPSGTFPKGLHWCLTTVGEPLITAPMSVELHDLFVSKYYDPFHNEVKNLFKMFGESAGTTSSDAFRAASAASDAAAGTGTVVKSSDEVVLVGAEEVRKSLRPIYHLDAHSMPSRGTGAHNDPGEERADIVVSDFHGKSCRSEFKDIVIQAYLDQGFKVAYNWPYFGGGITQMYGRPQENHHTLQVELNRKTYMNEDTKQMNEHFKATEEKIGRALVQIAKGLQELKD